MNISEMIATLAASKAQALEDDYEVDEAEKMAVRDLVDNLLYYVAGNDTNAHGYWNTDTDYYCDFWDMPSPAVCARLEQAAVDVLRVTGVTVHLVDCSSGYADERERFAQ